MKTFYFTFGTNHLDHKNNSLGRYYTSIQAFDENQARDIMIAYRGIKWSMVYTESMRPMCIDRHKLSYCLIEYLVIPPENV